MTDQTLSVPLFADGVIRAKDYTVQANGKTLPVLEGQIAAMAYATVDGPVTVEVQRREPFESVVVRPLSAGIKPQITGDTVRFNLPRAMNLSIEFDDDILRPLFLFTCPTRPDAPTKGEPDVVYFEAGQIHEPGCIELQSGQTVYIEPGAVVRGVVRAERAENVKILGGGVLDQSTRIEDKDKMRSVQFTECRDVVVQDVHIHNAFGWTLHPRGCDNVLIENHKQTGWRANSDGIDIEACHNVTVRHCFLRNADDCIAVKTKDLDIVSRCGDPAVDNLLIEKSVFWNTVPGNALEIGFELCGATVRNVTFRDCDVIRVERGAVFSIHNGDSACVHDILFENIRVEDARDELLDLYIGLSVYSKDAPDEYSRRTRNWSPEHLQDPVANDNIVQWIHLPADQRAPFTPNRGRIDHITLRDIRVSGETLPPSLIKGWDSEQHNISHVRIENVRTDTQCVRSVEQANIVIENVEDLQVL